MRLKKARGGASRCGFCVEVDGVEGKGRVFASNPQIQTFKVRFSLIQPSYMQVESLRVAPENAPKKVFIVQKWS